MELGEDDNVPDLEELRKLSKSTVIALAKISERLAMANGVMDQKGLAIVLPWAVATDLKLESGIGEE